ncbi:hypothetical protein LOK49_LG15G00458 [Camellia lanceoleosa]|uniref:Uncharacterized protein n=1 Tax=Camellia lanceoleosa TaxID=1840588 RepID=A0ACC0F4X8_9ERIC|nr:hypothetical protein LOK49_LG15G00458 [Camellia lanceoleosa]
MEENPATPKANQENQEVEMLSTPSEVPQKKSFKQALTATKPNKKAFGNDLNRLSTGDEFLTDEENNEALSEDEQEQDLVPKIPRIKLPPRLVKSIRKPWKDCLIVRLLGKTVGHSKEYCNLKPVQLLSLTLAPTHQGGVSNSLAVLSEQIPMAPPPGPTDDQHLGNEAQFGP